MSVITCLVEPKSQLSYIQYYEDIESFEYVKVLKGEFKCPDVVNEIRLRAIRFSMMHTEQWQDFNENSNYLKGFYDVSKHLTAQTVEKLPYMVHVIIRNAYKMHTNDSKVLTPPWIATRAEGQHQEPQPANFNTKLDTSFTYSTHADLQSFFQCDLQKSHLENWERSYSAQMSWYYNIQRHVPIALVNLGYEDTVEFEIIMTNVRGKRIIGHYLPPVEVEFELL